MKIFSTHCKNKRRIPQKGEKNTFFFNARRWIFDPSTHRYIYKKQQNVTVITKRVLILHHFMLRYPSCKKIMDTYIGFTFEMFTSVQSSTNIQFYKKTNNIIQLNNWTMIKMHLPNETMELRCFQFSLQQYITIFQHPT